MVRSTKEWVLFIHTPEISKNFLSQRCQIANISIPFFFFLLLSLEANISIPKTKNEVKCVLLLVSSGIEDMGYWVKLTANKLLGVILCFQCSYYKFVNVHLMYIIFLRSKKSQYCTKSQNSTKDCTIEERSKVFGP